MKKILFFIVALCFVQISFAQSFDAEKSAALQLVKANQSALGLSADDANNLMVSVSYVDKTTGIRYAYLQQTYKGIPVYNQMQVVTFRNNAVLSNAGGRISSIEQKVTVAGGSPSLSAEAAVIAAISDRKLSASQSATAISRKQNGREVEFGNLGVSKENIVAHLMWVPSLTNPNEVALAWQVRIVPVSSSDYWLVRIDAANGKSLGADNLTVYCNWDDPNHKHMHLLENKQQPTFNIDKLTQLPVEQPTSPTLADNASYRVVKLPAEAPTFPGGAPQLVTNPWTAAAPNAATLKWHSTDATGTDYNYTRGNNVWAYHDRNSQNSGDPSRSATSTTALPNLTFDFVPDLTQPPINTTPPNQQFNITNLFYANNMIHDIMYTYGFDEVAGNFQFNNLGRGGLGNDHVNAEAQDGGGTNNANFLTPADGGNGRMQMYLWTLTAPQRDGDVDNGIIFHEFGHGISNRLTGGPANSSCLGNAEQMGEGWSDYYGLMLTQDWAAATLNTGFNSPRGIGTYALGQPVTGVGIRSQRYCTDFTVNNKVYAATIPASPHDRGEIWCAALWDMTWNIIQQVGTINPNIYDLAGGGGNNIAMKLVTEGMKLQPCSPGFITGRDAIIQADINLYGGAHICAIKEAFRRRGMGDGASQGLSTSVTDQVPSFVGTSATFSQQPQSTTACAGTSVSFTVVATGSPTFTYQWEISTDGGVTWTNIASATAATYTFTAAAADNGNRYRCKATSTCGVITSTGAILTITTFSNGGSIAPAAANACSPVNSTTLTLAGNVGNIIRWEFSTDGGTTWTNVANTTATLTATNITQTRIYRALVQSTGCTASYSATSTITYIAAGVGALTITADNGTTLCQGDPTLLTAVGLTTNVFTSAAAITIPGTGTSGIANPYPSTIAVSGLATTGVTVKSVTLTGFNHTFPDDVDIVLRSPTGVNVILMSDVGGGTDAVNATYTFDDAAAALMSDGALNASGTYRPTNFVTPDNFVAPGPGSITQANPALSMFTGDLNGNWSLYAVDDVGGDLGSISGGFSITFASTGVIPGLTYTWSPAAGLNATNINPVAASPAVTTTYTVNATNGACSSNASITITINQRPRVTAHPANTSVCAGAPATFNVTATGTGITYQWQESINGGTTWVSLNNGAPYAGVNTAALTVSPTTSAMNNNRYRCVINGICPPAANSNAAILTVVALPVVTVTPASGCGGVAGTNGLALTAAGADTYTWSPIAGLYSNTNATTAYVAGTNAATVYAAPTAFTAYTVRGTSATTGCSNTATALINYTPPAPNVTPNPVTMCLGDLAVKLKSSSSTSNTACFTSGALTLAIPDNNPAGVNNSIAVSGIPASATIADVTVALNMTHTWDGDMVFALRAPNGQILNLDYYLSGTGGAGATTGFTNTRISSTGTAALSSGTNPYNGIFRADRAAPTAAPASGPTGFTPTTQQWADLYTPVTGVNGNWTLAMYDGGPADVGTLTNWQICFTYVLGVPATPAVWSPAAGLFSDAAASTPYVAGTAVDSVWVRPTPSGVYTYQATVQSMPLPATAIATTFANNNQFGLVTSNFRNNNSYAVTITGVESIAAASGASTARLYYRTTPISAAPGAITAANGWTLAGTGTYTAVANTTTTTPQLMLSNASVVVPPGATYGIAFESQLTGGAANLRYSTVAAGTYVNSGAGCDVISGTGVSFAGDIAPAAPTFTPRAFIGRLLFTGGSVAACTSPARTVTVTVNQPVNVTAQPVNRAVCTNGVTSFTVAATGTAPTYQWQVSTNNGNTFTNITNGGVYAGATTTTLTITAPPVSMNTYLYRCMVTGAAPCGSVPSNNALLTVNPLPTIVISAAPYTRLFPGLKTSLSSTVTPAAATYTWLRNGGTVAGGTGSSLVVDVDGLGDYTLRVTDVNGCVNTSNTVSVKDSVNGKVFIYPNPNNGRFQVRYYSTVNNIGMPRGINVYDARGKRVLTNSYAIGASYQRMDIDLSNHGTGVYWIEVVDVNGERLAVGRAEVLR
jgi:subtilisin-like proprotein convertase family protein